jgi:hypothetical protein
MITIGADPELFLVDKNKKLISAVNLIGGTKEAPLQLTLPGCAIQEDNVAAEFNIPACTTFNQFHTSIQYVLQHLKYKVKPLGLSLASKIASHSFTDDQLETWQAMVFGCEPDFNAWTNKQNPSPKVDNPNLRSAGGHIHIGTNLDKLDIIKSMDLHLGVESLLLDKDKERRKLYGKAGAFRPKSYGVEYRTLSNFWIWSDEYIKWAWDRTNQAIKFVEDKRTIRPSIQKDIQLAINQNNEQSKNNCLDYLYG